MTYQEQMNTMAEALYEQLLDDPRVHEAMTRYAFDVMALPDNRPLTDEQQEMVIHGQMTWLRGLLRATLECADELGGFDLPVGEIMIRGRSRIARGIGT